MTRAIKWAVSSGPPRFTTAGMAYYIRNMAMRKRRTPLVCDARSGGRRARDNGSVGLLPRAVLADAGVMFAELLAESLVLLRLGVTGQRHRRSPGLPVDELSPGASLCCCWPVERDAGVAGGWTRDARARMRSRPGVWREGTYEHTLRMTAWPWREPDGSAAFLPWSALAGACEPGRGSFFSTGRPQCAGLHPKERDGATCSGRRAWQPDPGGSLRHICDQSSAGR